MSGFIIIGCVIIIGSTYYIGFDGRSEYFRNSPVFWRIVFYYVDSRKKNLLAIALAVTPLMTLVNQPD